MKKKNSLKTTSQSDDNMPFKQAIALHYNEDTANPVPKVTATGQDDIAQKIIALAKEHGIPIHEDPDLAVLLSQLELYEDIPESLYHVVAEVLAFAYIVSGKKPGKFKSEDH
ncbi:MAG: EscU/YscU/HrcU family type III secretion system export apparatus switch protein [gamma proteobacterium symbiont of Bathyaustriella thionipta]|nr:EscU/YscU/HrcU family type III secretion system export apparatus switch protein [gamma proteobacterium symbiont of Bathyaustriella thionipta]MCU7949114.1 EscU/YscU/HrcU family type III secretion system export apparatus switch protein [gamma proteobacterium symbiont of Bathyaustriella thionipta]MCU7954425.1 EscU/YscU/HrcU family type III secretion system export apparatus switch protein [gamma proteobacterium symbiont of Bathyaustriella thionipta]MCU7955713.1 EscU/YscU/HrcU family type III secr